MSERAGQRGPWRRRVTVAWLAATFLLANAVTAGFLIALADRHRVRLDVTATGEHRLAEQTLRLLGSIEPGERFELVVAADLSRVDPRAWQALLDVGSELEARGPVTLTALDGAQARAGLEALVQRLAQREAAEIEGQARALDRAATELQRAAQIVESEVASSLSAAADAAGEGSQLGRVMRQRAQAAPRLAADLRDVAASVRQALQEPIMPGVAVPAMDEAISAITAPSADAVSQLALLADEARAIVQDRSFSEGVRRSASDLSRSARAAQDLAAAAQSAAQQLQVLDTIRVLRTVDGSAAAILVGPESAVAIDAQTLLPPPGVLRPEAATGPSLRGRVEGLVSTAMLTALDPSRPIVVVAHAEESRFIERQGALGIAIAHLRRQGVEVLEWPLMLEPEPPGLLRLDPSGARPVIHLVLNTNTSVRSPDPMAARPDERAAKLGELVSRLVEAGAPLIVNVTPSEVVVGGGVDATAAPLAAFGLHARSGFTLLDRPTEGGPVEHDMLVRSEAAVHPLQGAVAQLLAYMPWAVPIEHRGEGAAWPLLVVEDEDAWAESAWSGYRRVPRAERPLVGNPPTPDADADDVQGPWTIAWAAEREVAGDGQSDRGRIVVVGSNDWLADDILSSGQSIDGRMAASYPGNLALLDAAVLWLAGRDGFIAPTVSSSSVAMIGPIDDRVLSALRWGLVLGVPALILLVGGLWRVLRR